MTAVIDLKNHGWTETQVNYLSQEGTKEFIGFFPEFVSIYAKAEQLQHEYHTSEYLKALESYNQKNVVAEIADINPFSGFLDVLGSFFKWIVLVALIVIGGFLVFLLWPFFVQLGKFLGTIVSGWSSSKRSKIALAEKKAEAEVAKLEFEEIKPLGLEFKKQEALGENLLTVIKREGATLAKSEFELLLQERQLRLAAKRKELADAQNTNN